MSVKVMSAVFDCDIKPPSHKLVLLAYADHADHEGGSVYPAVATIAKKSGLTERQVQRIRAKFVKYGLMVPVAKRPNNTIEYKISLQKIAYYTEHGGVTLVSPPKNPSGDMEGTQVVTPEYPSGDIIVSPESSLTIIKPSISESEKQKKDSTMKPSESPGLSDNDREFWKAKEREKAERQSVLDKPIEDMSAVQHFNDEVVMRVVKEFNVLWEIPIPSRGMNRVTDWSKSAKEIIDVCSGYDVLDVMRQFKKHNDAAESPIEVYRPGSLINPLARFIASYKAADQQPQLFDGDGEPVFYG